MEQGQAHHPPRRTITNWLDNTRPAAAFAPPGFDVDPRAALARNEILFEATFPFLALALAALLLWPLLLWMRLSLWVLAAAIPAGLLVWWLWRGTLRCTAEHVEFTRRSRTVRCPWALFAVPGQAYGERQLFRMCLPIDAAMLQHVQLLHRGEIVSTGAGVKGPVRFAGSRCAIIHGHFGADLETLAPFLHDLACSMARRAQTPRRVPAVQPQIVELPVPGAWMVVDLSRYEPPDLCARCGDTATHLFERTLFRSGALGLIAMVVGVTESITIQLPACGRCWSRLMVMRVTIAGVLSAALIPAVFLSFRPALDVLYALLVAVPISVGVAAFVAWALGDWLARMVKVRRYAPRQNTVEMRSRSEAFMMALQPMRAR